MVSTAATIDGAIQEFVSMRSFQPFRLGGKWYIAQEPGRFVAYRTKKAAAKNTIGQVWFINFAV